MKISVLNVQKNPATTSKGQAYEQLDIAFKNLTFQGKVEGKKLTPFGDGKAAYDALANAQSGQIYEITVVKNNGFNNWTAAQPSTAEAPSAPSNAGYATKTGAAPASRGFETPEERAAKQVFIVRQSSLATAERALSVGSKSVVPAETLIDYARKLESYVFDTSSAVKKAEDKSGFDSMDDDIPF